MKRGKKKKSRCQSIGHRAIVTSIDLLSLLNLPSYESTTFGITISSIVTILKRHGHRFDRPRRKSKKSFIFERQSSYLDERNSGLYVITETTGSSRRRCFRYGVCEKTARVEAKRSQWCHGGKAANARLSTDDDQDRKAGRASRKMAPRCSGDSQFLPPHHSSAASTRRT